MGTYIGMIEIKGAFYNYRPIGRVDGDMIVQIGPEELEYILPGADFHNLVLSYITSYSSDDKDFMKAHFDEKSVVVFDFELSDLVENTYKTTAGKSQNGYKTIKKVRTLYDEGKIQSLKNLGWSYAIRKDRLKADSDFVNDDKVELDIDSPAMNDENVFIEREGGFWAGPYNAMYRDSFRGFSSSIVVKPKIRENKYTISGYNTSQMERIVLTNPDSKPDFSCELIRPAVRERAKQIDMISDTVLISDFKDSIEGCFIKDGCVDLSNIDEAVKHFEYSSFMGYDIPDSIRHSRIEKIKEMITSEEEFADTLDMFSTSICDLLIRNKDNPKVNEWVGGLISDNPELLDNLQSTKTIQSHIASLSSDVDELNAQKEQLESKVALEKEELESLRAQADTAKSDALIREKKTEYDSYVEKVKSVKEELGILDDYSEIGRKLEKLTSEVSDLEKHKASLENETTILEKKFDELVSSSHDRMADVVFDGFISSRMLSSASEWEKKHGANEPVTPAVTPVEKTPEETVEYLTKLVKIRRPNYKRNTIVNIAICMTQGFLTVFSGEPGSGKTSICNIFGEALGLNKTVSPGEGGRYVPVSIERGWTSKRDFVGYYNPLSKTFDKSNKRVYEALKQLDEEKKKGQADLPYIILLDEANLSPMEYYWSDFMNICDDLGPGSTVNLGENYIFGIPETLHFVATINNDHTTETLSPRLIDRAWIITLPQLSRREYSALSAEVPFPSEDVETLSWKTLKTAFIPSSGEISFSPEIQKCYDLIIDKLREKKISVSPRIDRAIKRYWTIASRLFEEETQTSPSIIALDYAVQQRILPKINGSGEDFEAWLSSLASICSNNGLSYSSQMINDMIAKGRDNMKYYHFFG